MGLNYNVYVGWYAQFTEYEEKVSGGVQTVRQCPANKNHPADNNFCPVCGE